MLTALKGGFSEFRRGVTFRPIWIALAQEDITDQHRLTLLGPVWLVANYLAFVGTFVFVFNHSSASAPDYTVYVSVGLFVWLYLMEVMTQSPALFAREESFIKGTTLPLAVYVMRLTMQSVIRAGYALIGCLAIILISGATPSWAWLWSALALLFIVAVTPAVVTIFAFTGTFFPDSQYIIGNALKIGMFLTPVFWKYDNSGGLQHAFYYWNPFTYFLDIVRIPMLTGSFPIQAFLITLAIGALAWLLALFMLGAYRKQLVFML